MQKANVDAKHIKITVSLLEAAVIHHMRKYNFGTFEIEKKEGEPIFIKTIGSAKLEPIDGIRVPIDHRNIEKKPTVN